MLIKYCLGLGFRAECVGAHTRTSQARLLVQFRCFWLVKASGSGKFRGLHPTSFLTSYRASTCCLALIVAIILTCQRFVLAGTIACGCTSLSDRNF